MSFFFYGLCILGVALGGFMLLVLYSLLAMAQRRVECLDQLELEMLKHHKYASQCRRSEKS
jgi:hypothetical protein